MHKPMILVGDPVGNQREATSGARPRFDYEEIARLLEADVWLSPAANQTWQAWMRGLGRRLRLDLLAAQHALNQIARVSMLLSTSEKQAIPIAWMSQRRPLPVPHVVIAHKLSSGRKANLFRLWPLHRQFDFVINVCRTQSEYAIHHLGLPEDRVAFFHDKVDHRFFQPVRQDSDPIVLAVGTEQRDYPTLLKAVAGTGIRLVILASSRWSAAPVRLSRSPDVTVLQGRLSYLQLRTLYAQARLVVVPLQPVDYAAGVNTLLEAMAMARPVIVTRSPGIQDYVVDGTTGAFSPPGDATHLRMQILRLWSDASSRARLGDNARQAIESRMNLDIYARKVAQVATLVQERFPRTGMVGRDLELRPGGNPAGPEYPPS